MNIYIQEKATIISDSYNDLNKLLVKLENERFNNQNIILDLKNYKTLKPKDLNLFLVFAKNINKSKNSFVILITDFDFNKASDKLNIVPTIQEAFDIIEMENIERDLGF